MSLYVVVWVYYDMKVYSFVDVKGSINFMWNVKLLVYGDEVVLEYFDEVVVYFEFYDVNFIFNCFIGYFVFFLMDLFVNIILFKEFSEFVFLNFFVSFFYIVVVFYF